MLCNSRDRDGIPEVIRDNHAAVALYQSLGFTRRYGLCGYLSTELLAPVPGVLQLYPTLSLLRRAIERVTASFRLLDPLTFATLPCQVVTLEQRAFAVLTTAGSRPVLSFCGWSPPPAAGLARELLMALAQQFPGIGTSVTVPETFTPLFAAAGYTPLSLQQYEMTMDLADAKSAASVRWTAKTARAVDKPLFSRIISLRNGEEGMRCVKRNCWLFAKSDRFFDPDNLSEVFTASWLARRFAMQKKYRQPLSQSAGRSGRAGENQHPAGLFSA